MTAQIALYRYSSARENLLEHVFIAELLKTCWLQEIYDVEVLRSEVDDCGYDLAIECRGTLRHLQLKSTHLQGKASRQNINVKVANKDGGCVVWMIFDADFVLRRFHFLGDENGKHELLRGRVARRTTANSKGVKPHRQNIRVVNKAKFSELGSMKELVDEMFPLKTQCGLSS